MEGKFHHSKCMIAYLPEDLRGLRIRIKDQDQGLGSRIRDGKKSIEKYKLIYKIIRLRAETAFLKTV